MVPPAGEAPADRVAEPADPGDAILDVTVIDEDGQPIGGYAFETVLPAGTRGIRMTLEP